MKSTTPAGPARPERGDADNWERRAALVDQLLRRSKQAADARGGFEDIWIDLAGRPVLLRFGSDTMAEPLLPALRHLTTDPQAKPALTIRVWDSESTGTEPPVPPWGLEDFRERGVIRGFFGDGFFTFYEWGPRALNVVDRRQGLAFHWMRSTKTLGLPERGAPLRALLNTWLTGGETQLVHGAAVGRPDGCVLLIGPSGAGKSSTALSCIGSALKILGEDYCLVTGGSQPIVSSVYSTGKLAPAAVARLPRAARFVAVAPPGPDPGEKALLDLHAVAAEHLLKRSPLRAIAVPQIGEGPDTSVEPCTSGAALAAVAPSTMLQLPGNGAHEFRWLASLVSSVPTVRLRLGSDPAGIPSALEQLLGPG
jgi:hypothetical protein